MNKINNVEKSHTSICTQLLFHFLSLANRTCSTLTRQLEAVIIEVSTVQLLRL